jgi:hypothetical protein
MITSDRRARMLLSCAVEGGDPAIAELVQNLGAEGAWAKIIEGVLGEPVAQRARLRGRQIGFCGFRAGFYRLGRLDLVIGGRAGPLKGGPDHMLRT